MEPGRTSPRAPGRTRRIALGAAAGLSVAVLLLLVTPNTLGAVSAQAVVLAAPYKGTHTGLDNGWSTTGCASATIVAAPFFDPHTGDGGFADRAASRSCTSNPVSPSASADSGFLTEIPVHLGQASVTIVAITTVVATARAHLNAGMCMPASGNYSCYLSAYADLYGDVYLLDQTSGLVYYPTAFWSGAFESAYNYTFCYGGNCSYYTSPSMSTSISTTIVWTIDASYLNTADTFQLVSYFWAEVGAYQAAGGATQMGASAAASVNMGTMGNGYELDSITIV